MSSCVLNVDHSYHSGMHLRILLVLCAASAIQAQVPKIDWEKQKTETLKHYRSLIQIDTQNPPGNESKAVEYLKDPPAKATGDPSAT